VEFAPVLAYRCAAPATSGIVRLASGCDRAGTWVVRCRMVIGPPFLMPFVTRQGGDGAPKGSPPK
jgi:hypothetical protein